MGIKPALGWLALLLFTTTAQAEGPARDLINKAGGGGKGKGVPSVASVTPKTKAPPSLVAVSAQSTQPQLSIVENTGKPRGDYEAEIYSGVPLDGAIAKERGFDKGLVTMMFEHQKRGAFRVGREHIRRVVRLAAAEERSLVVTTMGVGVGAGRAKPKDHVDVLELEEGSILAIDTSVQSSGMFTASDVYVFAKNATLDARIGAVEALPAIPTTTKARLREALVAAEWAPIKN